LKWTRCGDTARTALARSFRFRKQTDAALRLRASIVQHVFRRCDPMLPTRFIVAITALVGISGSPNSPQVRAESPAEAHAASMELPAEYRAWFKNPDGSCVQCSNGMVGMHINRPEWTFLLWDTPYGEAVHGGSWPGR